MAYILKADYKEYKGIKPSETDDDDLIDNLIDRAQSAIENHTHRVFEADSDTTKTFDAEADVEGLLLDWTPYGLDLASVTTVTNGDGTVVTSSQYVTEPRHNTPYYGIRLKVSTGLYWQYDSNDDPEDAISIVGRWAYSTTPPNDIVQATIRLVDHMYEQKDAGAFEVRAFPGAGMMEVPLGMPRDVLQILGRKPGDKYVRMV